MTTENNDILYHYCSPEAFLNIIQSSSIWLSDILKSNDSKEESWIREQIHEEVVDTLKINTEASHAWETWSTRDTKHCITMYVLCLSEAKDDLSQWRGYAKDGQGFAIGFSKTYLEKLVCPYSCSFGKVIYDLHEQQKFIKKIADENLRKMQYKGVGHCVMELNSNYMLQFPFYKNPSFVQEKEWRIVFLAYPFYPYQEIGREMSKKNRTAVQDVKSLKPKLFGPKFRACDSQIISYIEMNFSDIKKDFIKEIWIGPKSKTTPDDILNLLQATGYYDDGSEISIQKPITISRSSSTYR